MHGVRRSRASGRLATRCDRRQGHRAARHGQRARGSAERGISAAARAPRRRRCRRSIGSGRARGRAQEGEPVASETAVAMKRRGSASCHPDRALHARGLCGRCYRAGVARGDRRVFNRMASARWGKGFLGPSPASSSAWWSPARSRRGARSAGTPTWSASSAASRVLATSANAGGTRSWSLQEAEPARRLPAFA
jgi:hypothetical protein